MRPFYAFPIRIDNSVLVTGILPTVRFSPRAAVTRVECVRAAMNLFFLDYGDLIRPPFRILQSRGWGQCTILSGEALFVYGPKHTDERSIFDTSPYVLEPGLRTPDGWDCDGFLLPSDRVLRRRGGRRRGPLAVKFWNYRHFVVRSPEEGTYRSSWDNGVYQPSQINWAIPNFTYREICARLDSAGA